MNTTDLTYLLNKPKAINDQQTLALELALIDYPFFQSARALYLKGLFNQGSFRYNYELKKTAALTQDRNILFEFISSNDFNTLQKNNIEEQEAFIKNFDVADIEFITSPTEVEKTLEIEKELEIGKPFHFEETEKHSFSEWLQLTKFAPIERNETEKAEEINNEISKKFDLIDKFIENNPKISSVKDTIPAPANISKSVAEPTHLMTETLAQIYLEQKKYQRAIQAYEILILKYPEKSSFFADRINEIKNLQQNNN